MSVQTSLPAQESLPKAEAHSLAARIQQFQNFLENQRMAAESGHPYGMPAVTHLVRLSLQADSLMRMTTPAQA
jgi:hypothetical protein